MEKVYLRLSSAVIRSKPINYGKELRFIYSYLFEVPSEYGLTREAIIDRYTIALITGESIWGVRICRKYSSLEIKESFSGKREGLAERI